jgi:general secretion pathway protein N
MRAFRIGVGILAVLLLAAAALAWTAPAQLVVRWYADRLGPVRLQGVSGSLWQGEAAQLVVFDVALGPVHWTVDRGAALGGAIRGTLDLTGESIRASGRFAESSDGWRIEGLDATLPAPLLAPALDLPALGLLGTVVARADHVVLRDGLLASARGQVLWRDLGVSGAANVRLPGLRIDVADAPDGAVVGEVADLGGPLAIAGEVRIKDGHFLSETRLDLREPEPRIAEALKFIGQRTPEGGSYLRIEGQLHPISP